MPEIPNPPTANVQVFDRVALFARAMNDEDVMRMVIEGFLGDFPVQIEDFKNCLATGDAGSLARRLHNMKGVAATVSAEELRLCAVELEQRAVAGDLESVNAGTERLQECFARVKRAMLE